MQNNDITCKNIVKCSHEKSVDAMSLELSGELFKIDHNILLGTYNASTKTHVET